MNFDWGLANVPVEFPRDCSVVDPDLRESVAFKNYQYFGSFDSKSERNGAFRSYVSELLVKDNERVRVLATLVSSEEEFHDAVSDGVSTKAAAKEKSRKRKLKSKLKRKSRSVHEKSSREKSSKKRQRLLDHDVPVLNNNLMKKATVDEKLEAFAAVLSSSSSSFELTYLQTCLAFRRWMRSNKPAR